MENVWQEIFIYVRGWEVMTAVPVTNLATINKNQSSTKTVSPYTGVFRRCVTGGRDCLRLWHVYRVLENIPQRPAVNDEGHFESEAEKGLDGLLDLRSISLPQGPLHSTEICESSIVQKVVFRI